jgi:hypothetical protein
MKLKPNTLRVEVAMAETKTVRQITTRGELAAISDRLAESLTNAFYNDPYYVYIPRSR